MCGLSGVVKTTHLLGKEKKAFIDLGMLSFMRGTDSTGVASLTKKKKNSPKVSHELIKDVEHPIDFFKEKDVTRLIYDPRTIMLMGHARYATHGTINAVNAQPMRSGSIVGTHNGVVRRYAPSKQEEDTHTDSRKLFDAIDKEELQKVLNGVYESDSYALAFADLQYQTMNFVRNKGRPLFLCKSKDGAVFWSSEQHMLVFALGRNDIEWDDIDEVPAGVHMSLNLITGETKAVDLNLKPVVRIRATSSSYNDSAFGYTARVSEGSHHIIGNPPAEGPRRPSAKVVPAGWTLTDSMAASKTHKSMLAFMHSTEHEYKGKNDNVVPMTRGEVSGQTILPGMSATENLAQARDKEAAERIAAIMAATMEAIEDKPNFLKRPDLSESGSYVDLDSAEYRLRKNGVEQWVSGKVAESHLRHGCNGCHQKCSVSDTVHWKHLSHYMCDECFNDENMRDFYRIDPSEYVESDLMLDVRRSVYGG